MKTMKVPVDWLLEGEPWIEYRTRLDLLGQSEKDPQVKSARKSMLADAQVQSLVAELSGWPGTVISSHKSASQPFHKLTFLADLGLKAGDPGMDAIIARILEHQSDGRSLPALRRTSPPTLGERARINGPGRCAMRRSSCMPWSSSACRTTRR